MLYGDNASGKSSFLDALEWFISGKVAHLAGEEINLKDALKNVKADSEDESSVEVHFSTGLSGKRILMNTRILNRSKGVFKSNNSTFTDTVNLLHQEQLWMRSHNLVDFIIKTKKDRLIDISSIVGYEPITTLRETFVKSINSIKKQIQNRSFEQQKFSQQSIIEEVCGEKIKNKNDFYSAINELVQEHTSTQVVDEKLCKQQLMTLRKN